MTASYCRKEETEFENTRSSSRPKGQGRGNTGEYVELKLKALKVPLQVKSPWDGVKKKGFSGSVESPER